ncbi:MAG TPA: hypothetical protein EYF98_04945 [Planctomycetes bacterium]|nr:hypothetical protein [Planctomycetota bacterium]
MGIKKHLRASAAIEWLQARIVGLPADATHVLYRGGLAGVPPGTGKIEPNIKIQAVQPGVRLAALTEGIASIREMDGGTSRRVAEVGLRLAIPLSGFFLKSAADRAILAWNIAAHACRKAGLFAQAEVAWSKLDEADGFKQRRLDGESGGWANPHAVARATEESVDDAVAAAGVAAQVTRNLAAGATDAINKVAGYDDDGVKTFNHLVWIVPTVAAIAGTWYFWPFLAPLLRFRSGADKMLNAPSRQLPAPSGQPNFPMVTDFAGLSGGMGFDGSFVGFSEMAGASLMGGSTLGASFVDATWEPIED